MTQELDRFDDTLDELLGQHNGSVLKLFDTVFSYLVRKTDFFSETTTETMFELLADKCIKYKELTGTEDSTGDKTPDEEMMDTTDSTCTTELQHSSSQLMKEVQIRLTRCDKVKHNAVIPNRRSRKAKTEAIKKKKTAAKKIEVDRLKRAVEEEKKKFLRWEASVESELDFEIKLEKLGITPKEPNFAEQTTWFHKFLLATVEAGGVESDYFIELPHVTVFKRVVCHGVMMKDSLFPEFRFSVSTAAEKIKSYLNQSKTRVLLMFMQRYYDGVCTKNKKLEMHSWPIVIQPKEEGYDMWVKDSNKTPRCPSGLKDFCKRFQASIETIGTTKADYDCDKRSTCLFLCYRFMASIVEGNFRKEIIGPSKFSKFLEMNKKYLNELVNYHLDK